MNRLFATLAVFAMLLIAIAISVVKMLEMREQRAAVLLSVTGLVLVVGAGILLKRHFGIGRARRVSRSRFAIARPLRRLFSGVWS